MERFAWNTKSKVAVTVTSILEVSETLSEAILSSQIQIKQFLGYLYLLMDVTC